MCSPNPRFFNAAWNGGNGGQFPDNDFKCISVKDLQQKEFPIKFQWDESLQIWINNRSILVEVMTSCD